MKFLMFGRYSSESMTHISSQRTEMVRNIISNHGGEIEKIYALLGETDLLLLVDLPDGAKALHASIIMSKETGIQFRTSPAVEVEDFDQMMDN